MKVSVIGLRGFPLIEGGVEKHCESLYPKLKKDINVIVYRRKPYIISNETYDNISFIDLPSTKIKGFETVFHSFISSILTLINKPDLAHYHNIGPALFSPIVKLRKIPVVLTYHSPNYEHNKWNKLTKIMLLFAEKVALKTADRIIFVNSFQMNKYSDEIKKKSLYIPNGISDLLKSTNTKYLEQIGVEPNNYILSVGRITPEKGFDTLIKAYKLAKKDGIKLVIAGGVEFENGYMKQLQELSRNENVLFTGYVFGDNLHQLYTYARLYVLASNNEGFPLTLLEAMKYKLDVLVSDIPATHLVKLNKEDYFECGDYKTLSLLITERIIKMNKRTYDLKKYDWKKIADSVSDVFYETVRK